MILSAEESVFEHEEALIRMYGDRELFREVVGIFEEDSPKQMAEIRQAIAEGNASRLNRGAHTLKGAIGNFGASAAVEVARKLEMLGKSGELDDAPKLFSALEGEIVCLRKSLVMFVGRMEYEDTDSRG